ncbi:MAG: DUF386 family protein [Terrimonas sp.]|nr:DUF386 family protein [Terrimonas sp.]
MIVDTINNASRYFSVHPLFEKAFAYINHTDLSAAPLAKVEIEDGLKAIFSEAPGKTKEASLVKFECHNRHIDIQLCISGTETLGWKPREKCLEPVGTYNEEKDVLFYQDQPDTFFELTNGQFAVFFPEDVHAPMIGTGTIKKLVIKVSI